MPYVKTHRFGSAEPPSSVSSVGPTLSRVLSLLTSAAYNQRNRALAPLNEFKKSIVYLIVIVVFAEFKMGKKQHSKDRMFITKTEWATEWGGAKSKNASVPFKRLPFYCCAYVPPISFYTYASTYTELFALMSVFW